MASFVALIFVACGGGNTPTHRDGGPDDGGSHIQFDAQRDGLQQDAQGDGATQCGTTCDPSGGGQNAAWCKCASDCNCGTGGLNTCMNIKPTDTTVAGSCWKSCTSATDCASGTEDCIGITSTPQLAACLPKGTIAGTFSVPSWLESETMTQDLGTANVVMTIGTETVTFGGGWMSEATFTDGSTAWEMDLFPVAGGQIDVNRVLRMIIEPKTDYGVKSYDMSSSTSSAFIIIASWTLSGSAFTAQSIYAMVLGGTINITAAGAGAGALCTGEITAGEVFKYLYEICGSHSSPC